MILRNLDTMEAVKLNVFHWHLTDDQGFRVESKVFPKLHELGTENGEYYTQEDIRRIVSLRPRPRHPHHPRVRHARP